MNDSGADVNRTDADGKTALFYAVQKRDNESVVRALIDAGADVNRTDKKRETALFYAVQQSNNESVVRALIAAGADVNFANYKKKTALFRAVNNESVVRALIDAGADVNISDNETKTPLFYAAQHSNKDVVHALIDAGADVNFMDWGKQNALFNAIQQDDTQVARALIDAGADINIRDNNWITPLFYAARLGKKDGVRVLIEAGADVTFIHALKRQTALFYAFLDEEGNKYLQRFKGTFIDEEQESVYAAQQNKKYVVRALLDAGADVNVIDVYGQTALFNALEEENFNGDAIRALLDAGVDVNVVDNKKRNALFSIFKQETVNEDVFRSLLKAGIDVNVIDEEGQTVLFHAVQNDNENISYALIGASADVNIIDKEGKTALFHAIQHGKIEIVRALTGAGVDVNVIDKKGQTALFTVSDIPVDLDFNGIDKQGHNPLVSVSETLYDKGNFVNALIDAGVDVNVQDTKRRTALCFIVASKNDISSAVRSLIEAGADVNITDNDGKTALFFVNCGDECLSVARLMIEQGGALVDVRDHDGRTPLFFAMKRSGLSFAGYLLEKGVDPNLKDNYGTSVVSFFIESCRWKASAYFFWFRNIYSELDGMCGELALLTKHGVQRKTVCKALINALFCKMINIISSPCTFSKDVLNLLDKIRLVILYCDNNDKIQKPANLLLQKVLEINLEMININEVASKLPGLLALLIEMGAKPNHVDVQGNNALHYATRLTFVGIPQETVMEIFRQLKTFGVNFDAKNLNIETPLQYCFSGRKPQLDREYQINLPRFTKYDVKSLSHCFITLVEVWRFCLNQGTSVNGITKNGESVYHLILKLFSTPHRPDEFESLRPCNPVALCNIAELMKLSSSKISSLHYLVNHRDENLNTPLHLWASLEQTDEENLGEGYVTIFKHLLECGARLNERNEQEQTPLHLCKTWKAVKLLLDAGAEPNVLDSAGRLPLVVAVSERNRTVFRYRLRDIIYPDISEEPKEFFETAIEYNLDLWSIDKNESSVFENLTLYGDFVYAKHLLEVMRDKSLLKSDAISSTLLTTICSMNATGVHWMASLVEIILKARKSPISVKPDEYSPLHVCCRRIIRGKEFKNDIQSSVQWTIIKLLLSYGFKNIDTLDKSGQTCLEIAEKYPPLRELLLKPIDIKDVPLLVPWTSVSNRYQEILSKVARQQECQHTGSFWCYKDHLTSGSFGLVFAGINEKDGREVAIKRIEKLRLRRPEDRREIENLTALADCEQVVRYFNYFEEGDFSYIVLELMEGNLEEYLNSAVDVKVATNLSKDVLLGLKFLHEVDILHRDLKPANILYKDHPKLCFKIADFGLSRRTDNISTTVYGTNVGTRCWIAPEVLKAIKDHSEASDVFACGLVLHYFLSRGKHPFSPAVCGSKSEFQVNNETEANVINDSMEGWDNSLCLEATHLIKKMLDCDDSKRPSSAEALDHPLFWKKKKKQDLLFAVGNQPEIECPRAKVTTMTAVENDLEASHGTIVQHVKWNDPGYTHMPAIYTEMMLKRKMRYDPFSTVELVRFIRNAIAHVSGSSRPTPIRKHLLEDFVFLKYFPNLVMEVYKAVTTHGWDQTREEIKYAMSE